MPKRKVQKIKKKKKKKSNTKHQQNKQQCNVSFSILASREQAYNIVIEAKNVDHIVFSVKNKQNGFETDTAIKLLSHLAYSMSPTRWDLIANIASWCIAHSDHIMTTNDNDKFWIKYIGDTVPVKVVDIIIERIHDIYIQCIQSSVYYNQDWDSNPKFNLKLAQLEIELLTVGYLKNYIKPKNRSQCYIPLEIISLISGYYGQLSPFVYDTTNNILFSSTDPMERQKEKANKSPFICYGQYAIYKQSFIIKGKGDQKYMFHAKILENAPIFGVGFGIYNNDMSKGLRNGLWARRKDKYFENKEGTLTRCKFGKYEYAGRGLGYKRAREYFITEDDIFYFHESAGMRSAKWKIGDIISVIIQWQQDSITEMANTWTLSVKIYKNKTHMTQELMVTDVIYNENDKYKDCMKYLHLIIDKDPNYPNMDHLEKPPGPLKLQILRTEDVDEDIMKQIEWWKDLTVGDFVGYDNEDYDEHRPYNDLVIRKHEVTGINIEDGTLTIAYRYEANPKYEKVLLTVKRDCVKMYCSSVGFDGYHFYVDMVIMHNKLNVNPFESESFQFVAIL